MYACKMQTCCYNGVKYFVGIKFHFFHGLMLVFVLICSIGKDVLVF